MSRMKVVAVSTLRNFWERHPDSENPLKAWYDEARHAAELPEHCPGPVGGPGKIDHAADEAEAKCAQWPRHGFPRPSRSVQSPPADDGDEQGDQGDPGEGWVSELREAQSKKHPRQGRQAVVHQAIVA